jgi:hypothetical protein
LAYLADILKRINELNLSCQGKSVSIFIRDRISSLECKPEFWKRCIEKSQHKCFPTLNDDKNRIYQEETIYVSIIQHLNGLQQAFQKYFPSSTDDVTWV